MNNKKGFVLLTVGLFFAFMASCNLSAKDNDVYIFEAKLVTEKGKEYYDKAGLEVFFSNKADKPSIKFQVTYQLYDKDGMPFDKGVYEVTGKTEPGEYCHIYLNLDESFEEEDPTTCFADYLFINKIIYEDGTEYNDPHGLKYFLN